MKTITVNGTDIECSHESVMDEKANRPTIRLTVKCGDVESTHVMTIGPSGQGLPAEYGVEQIQKDFADFRQKCAEELEGRVRGLKLAQQVQ